MQFRDGFIPVIGADHLGVRVDCVVAVGGEDTDGADGLNKTRYMLCPQLDES